jgi:hypothetical protein
MVFVATLWSFFQFFTFLHEVRTFERHSPAYGKIDQSEVILICTLIIINRMKAEELTEYWIASHIDVQVGQVLDRLWSSLM